MSTGNRTHNVAWVRPPRQARSQETLDRILDAAETVVSEKGFDSASVAEIVRLAQSSVGAFYARFVDKDALLSCLHERFSEEALATTDAALSPAGWEGASIREILGETIPFVVRTYLEKRGLIRAFVLRGSTDTAFAESAFRVGRYVAEKLSALMMARLDEIHHPHPRMAVEFGLSLVLSSLDSYVMFEHVERVGPAFGTEEFSAELVRVYLRYLGVESA